MNIHPIIVHFPIAFLSMYVLFELLRTEKLLKSREWLYIKAVLLFVGGLGALAALATGDFGRSLYPTARAIIRVHQNFADMTVVIFGIIALIYLVVVADDLFGGYLSSTTYGSLWSDVVGMNRRFFKGSILVSLAILGILVLFTTGALGGSIVYGVDSDPFTRLVHQLFVH